MAEFKCRNCGYVFSKFCDVASDSINVECPRCRSHWVELYLRPPQEEQIIFPKLPDFDQHFSPVKYWYKDIKPSTTPWSIGW